MSWGAVAVGGGTVALGYLTAQQNRAAQESANAANNWQSEQDRALTDKQWSQERGELSESRRTREDEINRQIQERFDQNIAKLDPYSQGGQVAAQEQQALMGLSGAEAGREAMSRFEESPGQAFLRKRQEKSLLRNQAAIGGLGGGNVRTALQEQAFDRSQTDYDRRLARLGAISGQGMTATMSASQRPGYIQTGADLGVLSPEEEAAAAPAAPRTPRTPRGPGRGPQSGDRNDRGESRSEEGRY